MAIPASVEELTPAWLSEALGAAVDGVEVLDAHSGTTGRARLRLRGASGLPDTVFVKLQPNLAEQRQFLRATGLGVAEARFYAAAGNELPVRVPQVWHSSFDEAEAQFVMVLEDLVATDCRFPAPDDGDVLAVATSLFDELALLHATYWDRELPLAGHACVEHPEQQGTAQEHRRRHGDRAVGPRPVRRGHASRLPRAGRSLRGALARGGDPLERGRVHPDPRRRPHRQPVRRRGRTGFFDWAVASRFPGMRDVAYFLGNSLPTEVRRAEEDALLARYRAALADHGIELEPALQREQYRLFAVYSWISATTTAAMGSRWQPAAVAREPWSARRRP